MKGTKTTISEYAERISKMFLDVPLQKIEFILDDEDIQFVIENSSNYYTTEDIKQVLSGKSLQVFQQKMIESKSLINKRNSDSIDLNKTYQINLSDNGVELVELRS